MNFKTLTGAAALCLVAVPAMAHHPLGGVAMETFSQGMLSGVGHPILGFDHLMFVALMGIAAVYTGRAMIAPVGYILAMLAGCLLSAFGFALPVAEVAIAGSLLALGWVVLSGRALGLGQALMIFAGFGLFHGSAFGDTIAAQEAASGTPVLLGYLIGLGVTQYAVAVAAGWVARNIWNATEATAIQTRLAGAVVAGAGLLLSLEHAESAVFGMLGWVG